MTQHHGDGETALHGRERAGAERVAGGVGGVGGVGETVAAVDGQTLLAMIMEAPAAIAMYRGADLVIQLMSPLARRILRDRPVVGRPLLECAPELRGTEIHRLIEQVHATGEMVAASELSIALDRRGEGTLDEGYFNVTLQPLGTAEGGERSVMVFAIEVTDQVLARRQAEQLAAQLAEERHKLEQLIHQMPHAAFLAEAPSGRLILGNPQVSEQLHLLRAEQLLRKQTLVAEKRFRSMVEATAVVVWTTTPEGQVTEDSPSWRSFTGQTYEEWIGYGWLSAVHPEDRERASAAWRGAVETRSRYEVEYRMRRPDGSWSHTIARGVPLLDDDGNIEEWVGCNVDISDIRRAEEALRLQHQFMRTITDNAALGLFMMDARRRCTFMNPAAEKITGFTFEEVRALDRPLHDLVHHTRPDGTPYPMEECPIDRALPEKNQEQGEDVFVRRDGSFYPVAFTASPILDGGAPVGTVIELRDITAQKRAERERERLIAALERSNAELDQFAYVASHDLKAPLRGIANLSQWIEEDLGDALTGESREQMTLLRGRVHRMEALIEGILDYSRAGRGRHKLEPVDVGRLLAEAIELLAPAPEVRVEVAPGMPALLTERVPLQQVFMNLIANALKHAGRADPLVRVGFRDAGAHHEFSVADNGPGIAPEFHDRIWGLFQKLEARDRVEGAGIGLSVVKKIVESRGGRASVESAEGHGATFRFTWPKREREDER